MLNIFSKLFRQECLIESYWCDKTIKLDKKYITPLQCKVRVIRVCVDISYTIQKREIKILSVKLSTNGTKTMGTRCSANVASVYVGEAWYTSNICHNGILLETVNSELKLRKSNLVKIAYGIWRKEHFPKEVKLMCSYLNSKKDAVFLAKYIENSSMHPEVSFVYQNGNESKTYEVRIIGIRDDKLKCSEFGTDKFKLFFISQISNCVPIQY